MRIVNVKIPVAIRSHEKSFTVFSTLLGVGVGPDVGVEEDEGVGVDEEVGVGVGLVVPSLLAIVKVRFGFLPLVCLCRHRFLSLLLR